MKLFYRSFFFLFLLLLFHSINAQHSKEWVVEDVKFEGLKRTKVSFLQPFLKTKIGEVVNDSLLKSDVQRLKNIAGIGDAQYRMDSLETSLVVVFTLKELQTLLPIIKYGGIKDNFWFQAGIADINWLGRGQQLSAFYRNTDQRHSGELFYRIPYLQGSKWGASLNLRKWASQEPLYFEEGVVNYDYENNSLGLSIIRNFSFNKNLEIGGSYFIEKYGKSLEQSLENPPGPGFLRQEKWMTKLQYSENLLDYHFFYQQGINWRIIQQNVFNQMDGSWFHTLQFKGNKFSRIKDKGNIAMRLTLAISTNIDTPFAPFVVDSHVNIRGAGNRIDRGTAQFVFNTEYRHTFFENDSWAAQSVFFLDSGTWRSPGGKLEDLFDKEQFRQFAGGGLRLIYQKVYGAVFRIDYGIDVFNKEQHGFVIGLGQYF